ncbi:MAG: bifunctional folylpolyglutamate synthase/dihydrofolate synthase [Lachnospiraceae bacterium]|nr:bifunctional folylpolyglutamate synthase/dihydrofolate synthase [Lachnospiraceae bacterium]
MKYQEAMEYIDSCAAYGIVPGLESIIELLRRLDNPEKFNKFIHIAGTNGKGSTLAFISTALMQNGYKVGRYVSPTIVEYRERFQIQGKPISKAEVARLMEQVAVHADAMEQEGFSHPTPFEIETAMAFLLFKEKKCDFVVLETGMGGLLDATNVIENTLIAVLTSIDKDHSAYLGESLEEIATQKAGIIKNNCVVVSACQEEPIEDVIKKTAYSKGASEIVFLNSKDIKKIKYGLQKTRFSYNNMEKVEISLLGSYQIKNAALALEVLNQLQRLGYQLKEEKIRKAFIKTNWPARFQILDRKPYFIVDGAHNPAAAKELRSSLEFYFTNKKIIYIMGMFRDKDYTTVIDHTCDLASHIITVSKKGNPRALSALELGEQVAKVNPMVTVADSVEEAVELSYLLADRDTVIVAFGSLAYLGDCMKAVACRKEMGKDTHGQ